MQACHIKQETNKIRPSTSCNKKAVSVVVAIRTISTGSVVGVRGVVVSVVPVPHHIGMRRMRIIMIMIMMTMLVIMMMLIMIMRIRIVVLHIGLEVVRRLVVVT